MTVKVVGGSAGSRRTGRSSCGCCRDGAAPRSLGVVPSTGVGRVTLPALPDVALANVPALAVSLEQAGGSPTGAPQGPVLYTGRVEKFYWSAAGPPKGARAERRSGVSAERQRRLGAATGAKGRSLRRAGRG